MKFSKFLKDLLFTGFSQGVVSLLLLVLLKIMAHVLDEKSFGIFMVLRRWAALLIPLLTLSLGLSLTKFISSDRKKEDHYFKLALGVVNAIFLVLIPAVFLLDRTFSHLLFKTPQYTLLIKVFAVFLYSGALYLLIYSFYRGRQEMIRANILNLIYFAFPLLLAVVLWVIHFHDHYRLLVFYHSLYAVPVIAACFFYFLRKRFLVLFYPFKFKLKETLSFWMYALTRMPASLLLSFVLGLPLFWATYTDSLEMAGYVGIAVAVIRMMDIFTAPFNKLFLPKFSEFKGMDKTGDIKEKSMMVVDFIFTFLPVVVVLMHGLSKYIVIFWFGEKYMASIPALKIALLFSVFYLMFALIRGILNGIFVFPYVNIIGLLGGVGITLPMVTALNGNPAELSLSFGIGLFTLGVSSLFILMKKLKLEFPLKTFLIYCSAAAGIFLLTSVIDTYLLALTFSNIYVEFLILSVYRLVLFFAVFLLFWRRTVWYRELRKRMNVVT